MRLMKIAYDILENGLARSTMENDLKKSAGTASLRLLGPAYSRPMCERHTECACYFHTFFWCR